MSKQSQEFFEQLKSGQEPGLVESIKEAAASLKEVGGQLWDSMKLVPDERLTGRVALAHRLEQRAVRPDL